MIFSITTTSLQTPVIFNDLGARTFSHPTVNFNLTDEFTIEEIRESIDIFNALDLGYITATLDGVNITSTNLDNLLVLTTDPRLTVQNIVNVKKNPGIGEFSSIKDAIDSISDNSSTNRYLISVGPGEYIEAELDLSSKPYISISGNGIQTTVIKPSLSNHHIFKLGTYNELSFMWLEGAGSGYAAIACLDSGDYSQAHKITFNDCDINILITSETQDTFFYGEYIDFNGTYTYGVRIVANNGFKAYGNLENYYNFPIASSIGTYVSGVGSEASIITSGNKGNDLGTGILLEDGAEVDIQAAYVEHWENGIVISNTGAFSILDAQSLDISSCSVYHLNIDHSFAEGSFIGSLNTNLIINQSSSFVISATDHENKNILLGGNSITNINSLTVTSFTPGQIVFPSTGGLLAGSSNLFWDSATNRLGIGNSLPTVALDVTGSIKLSGTLTIDTLSGILKASSGVVTGFSNYIDLPEGTNLYYTDAKVIAAPLTGYTSGTGIISAADTVLQAIQKLNGNINALTTGVSSVNGLTGAVALTGTSDRITISVANVFDIASTYVGQISITTLGTITTGTWNGTIISPTYGGTGINNASRTLTINTNSGILDFTNSSTTLTISSNATVSGTNTGDNAVNTLYSGLASSKEDVSNKATSFATLNNILYPTTQAVSTYVTGFGYLTATSLPNNTIFTNALGQNIFATGSNKLYLYSGTAGIQFTNQANTTAIGDLTNTGDFSVIGSISASNLTGTNTGDQTLNSLLPSQTGNSGKVLQTDGSNSSWSDNYGTFGITIDGAGNVITTGFKQYLIVPYNCVIISWYIIANTVGSCVIDVWKDVTIPTSGDSITGTEKPTLTGQQTNSDSSLSTWTTTVNANDIIGFNVDSISGLSKITLVIKVRKI